MKHSALGKSLYPTPQQFLVLFLNFYFLYLTLSILHVYLTLLFLRWVMVCSAFISMGLEELASWTLNP
jgi:hypothetical protein